MTESEIEVDRSAPLRTQLVQAYLRSFEEVGIWVFAILLLALTVALGAVVPLATGYAAYFWTLGQVTGSGPVAQGIAWIAAALSFATVFTVNGSAGLALLILTDSGDADEE
ncbi:hypothetical protein [Haloarcula sp. JP-L23]|uniref:hypothetical protein n=1 Tax=Haloarcula sp. JP-L23 TaxID=2716717 RepID=UPI00140EC07A|nr:hypothetical protein G9465_12185 [Haloarcula sp. JP-L23]